MRWRHTYWPLPQMNKFPLESPLNTSPFSANAMHVTNLGFSWRCFRKETRKCCLHTIISQRYLIDSHFAGESASLHVPEWDLSFAVCYNDVLFTRMELAPQNGFSWTLQWWERRVAVLKSKWISAYFCFSDFLSFVLLPVPQGNDVLVGLVHRTQELTTVLLMKKA
jgi:hypothetical protein